MYGMLAFLFLVIEIGHRAAALDRARGLDRAARVQECFAHAGLAGACMARQGHVADIRSGVGAHADLVSDGGGRKTLRQSGHRVKRLSRNLRRGGWSQHAPSLRGRSLRIPYTSTRAKRAHRPAACHAMMDRKSMYSRHDPAIAAPCVMSQPNLPVCRTCGSPSAWSRRVIGAIDGCWSRW